MTETERDGGAVSANPGASTSGGTPSTANPSLNPNDLIVIDAVHCGPPGSGNGGWVSGLLAERTPTTPDSPAVTARLSAPPPLDRPLSVHLEGAAPDDDTHGRNHTGDTSHRVVVLQDGNRRIATATAAAESALSARLLAPATVAEAAAAEPRYEGLVAHPFPTCFSCGTGRSPKDALCLRPGPLTDGTGRYAARWTPTQATLPLVWAALDCPGGWSAGIAGRPMVLGQMTTLVHELPTPGSEHVITAWSLGGEGRKHRSASMLSTAQGRVLAVAQAIWIAVDPSTFGPAS